MSNYVNLHEKKRQYKMRKPYTPPAGILCDPEDIALLHAYRWKIGKWGYLEARICVRDKYRVIFFHKEVLGVGSQPEVQVDHINFNRLDNRKSNLRVVAKIANDGHRRIRPDNTSGFRGVARSGERWRAYVNVKGQQVHLGCFGTAEEAARVAKEWRLKNMPGALS